jgi:hypothetical protein
MTEEEAKTKWCPMFRCAGDGGNADADGGRRTKCIGTRCMMWRWQYDTVADGPDGVDYKLVRTTQGYCGLAGDGGEYD